jgi:hypothetical protein
MATATAPLFPRHPPLATVRGRGDTPPEPTVRRNLHCYQDDSRRHTATPNAMTSFSMSASACTVYHEHQMSTQHSTTHHAAWPLYVVCFGLFLLLLSATTQSGHKLAAAGWRLG